MGCGRLQVVNRLGTLVRAANYRAGHRVVGSYGRLWVVRRWGGRAYFYRPGPCLRRRRWGPRFSLVL